MTAAEPVCPQVIEYRIDQRDRIVEVSDNWHAFAVENNAPVKVLEAVGDSLWDHIYDHDTQDLYSLLLDSVRLSQQPLQFPYRCDSPSVKRFMQMTITPQEGRDVHFRSEIMGIELLPVEIAYTQWSALRIKEVHVCSNCLRVKVGKTWSEVAEAFGSGELTGNRIHFRAVHRVCPQCLHQMQERVSRLVAATDRRIHHLTGVLQQMREREQEELGTPSGSR